MSNERSTVAAENRSTETPLAAIGEAIDRLAARCMAIVHVAATVTLLSVVATTVLTILRNLPYDPVAVPEGLHGALGGLTPVITALALLTVALAARRDAVRVGLLFAGVFGLLATVDRAAALPAIVAVVGGGGLALAGVVGRPTTYREGRRAAIGGAIVVGVALSLASTAGLVAASGRGIGGAIALVGIASLGLRAEDDRLALLAGVLALLFVVLASATRPFVVGSALLVGFGVVGVPHLLVAVAASGAAMAVVAGVRRRDWALVAGAALLAIAGIPATAPQATATVLGATLALSSVDELVGDREVNT